MKDIIENRRRIATYLRHGAEMLSGGESATYQPEWLHKDDLRWIQRGEAEVCLSALVQRLGAARSVEVDTPENDVPVFIVHK